MKTLIIAAVAMTFMTLVGNLALAFLLLFKEDASGVKLSKADCIETCIRVIQNQSVFPPDYHRTVQKCNDVFAEVETCRLVK